MEGDEGMDKTSSQLAAAREEEQEEGGGGGASSSSAAAGGGGGGGGGGGSGSGSRKTRRGTAYGDEEEEGEGEGEGEEEEDDAKDETYGETKKKGGRRKKSAKVNPTSAGKKKLPPTAQMLSELRAAEIDVEKKIAKEKEHLDKLENTLKTEPPVVASVLKEMRDKIVPKGMGAKAGIQAINKFIGALEMWAEYKKSSLVLEDAKAEMEMRKEAYESAKAKEDEKAAGELPSSLGASNW